MYETICQKPLIGILANINVNSSKPLGKQTNLIQGFFQAASEESVQIGIFEPRALVDTLHPYGYVFDGNHLAIRSFSYPQVIYDRCYSSMAGFDKELSSLKNYIEKRRKIPFLNPLSAADTMTDKRDFGNLMDRLNIPSPEVILDGVNNSAEIWNHVHKCGNLILKPRYGRMGRGIIRLKWESAHAYVHYQNQEFRLDNQWQLAGFVCHIYRQLDVDLNDVILQKCINIYKYNDLYFDIRMLVQRIKGDSDPFVTGEAVRVAPNLGSVPNLDQGGFVIPLDVMVRKIFRTQILGTEQHRLNKIIGTEQQNTKGIDDDHDIKIESIKELLYSTAIGAYLKMERRFGLIGEIGMDLLIDVENKIWVIEMNSKPGRISFERLASGFGVSDQQKQDFAKIRKLSILNPVRYCKWLATHSNKVIR
jgi:hypothetical protein